MSRNWRRNRIHKSPSPLSVLHTTKSDLSPTEELYRQLHFSAAYFNQELFQGRLPSVLITIEGMQRRTLGYTRPDHFANDAGNKADQIALNVRRFHDRPLIDLFASLVHELCHVLQHHYGKPSRPGYHNREFAVIMLRVGLSPFGPDGKSVGQHIDQRIMPGGPFEIAANKLIQSIQSIAWFEARKQMLPSQSCHGQSRHASANARGGSGRAAFRCRCRGRGTRAWGAASLRMLCLRCQSQFQPIGGSTTVD